MATTPRRTPSRTAHVPGLSRAVVEAMRVQLPGVAEQVVGAIQAEVPSYADPFRGEMGRTIENAVALALAGFLDIATDESGSDTKPTVGRVADAAYALGRGEARSGRSMDALLSAYRVGARVAWRDMSGYAVTAGLGGATLARFAELVFAYIDELSASSVAGHADELATTGRVRQRYLDRLSQALLRGSAPDALEAAAERAGWKPPRTLTAVLLPDTRARGLLGQLDPRTLQPTEDVPGLEDLSETTVLLVPDAGGRARAGLRRALVGRQAVMGPARPWTQVLSSFDRALRVLELGSVGDPVDTETQLTRLVVSADPEALADLRAQALAPLHNQRPAVAEKLTETLRSWLLHHGRREEIAAALFVHPQTVRYRMGQLRELYGEKLDDPEWVLRLTIALA